MLRVIDLFLLVNNKVDGMIILEIGANGWHLRVIAQAIAEERLEAFSDAHGDSITASIGPKNKTTDTVDWHAIASPEPEDDYNIER